MVRSALLRASRTMRPKNHLKKAEKSPQKKWRRGNIATPSLVTWGMVRWLELYRDAGVERGFGAGSARTGDAAYGSGAGKRRGVVIEAELVLPVTIGNPHIDEVRIFRAPDRLGSVHGQADWLGVEFDLGGEHLIGREERQRLGIRALPAIPSQTTADREVLHVLGQEAQIHVVIGLDCPSWLVAGVAVVETGHARNDTDGPTGA